MDPTLTLFDAIKGDRNAANHYRTWLYRGGYRPECLVWLDGIVCSMYVDEILRVNVKGYVHSPKGKWINLSIPKANVISVDGYPLNADTYQYEHMSR
jgi:hypothetical protein